MANTDERDAIADVLVLTELSDYAGTDMRLLNRAADELLAAGYRKESVVRIDQIAKDACIAGDYTWDPDAHPNHGVVIAATLCAQLGALGGTK